MKAIMIAGLALGSVLFGVELFAGFELIESAHACDTGRFCDFPEWAQEAFQPRDF